MDLDVLILLVAGAASIGAGLVGFVRGRRRMSLGVAVLAGVVVLVMAGAVALARAGLEQPLIVVGLLVAAGAALAYVTLAGFLIVNGVVVLARESFSLGNSLALLTGILMIGLPEVLLRLVAVVTDSVASTSVVVVLLVVVLGVLVALAYAAVCFLVFALSTVLYLRLPRRKDAGAVVVLGSGLVGGRVTPLLASRLERAAALELPDSVPIITSGGQGADESRPEGEAMREYLVRAGVDPDRVIAETESSTTRENLVNSARIAGDGVPLVVVTSAYHTFRAAMLTRRLGLRARVVGARTARYYVPSALLREFVAVMRDHWRTHVVFGVLIVGALAALGWEALSLR